MDELKYINIRAHRRKEKHAETDDYEKSQLRSLLCGISWHAQQVAPHFSAEVGLLLSEINRSTVETLNKANQLLHQVKNMRSHRLKVHSLPLDNLGLFAWCDAAKQNRCDGSICCKGALNLCLCWLGTHQRSLGFAGVLEVLRP